MGTGAPLQPRPAPRVSACGWCKANAETVTPASERHRLTPNGVVCRELTLGVASKASGLIAPSRGRGPVQGLASQSWREAAPGSRRWLPESRHHEALSPASG